METSKSASHTFSLDLVQKAWAERMGDISENIDIDIFDIPTLCVRGKGNYRYCWLAKIVLQISATLSFAVIAIVRLFSTVCFKMLVQMFKCF